MYSLKRLILSYAISLFSFSVFAQWTPDTIITPSAVNATTNEYMASCISASGDSLHVIYADHRSSGTGIWYLHSYDNGLTWSAPVPVWDTLAHASFPAVASSGSMVHAVWFDSIPGSKASFYRQSGDGGQTWGPVLVIDSTTKFWPGLACWDSLVVVSLNEDLSGNTEVFFRRSIDGGITWDPKQQISNGPNRSEDPAINVLGNDVHLSWNDKRSGTMNIYYRHSSDAGLTWGPELQLTTADSYTEMVCLDRNYVDVPCGINTGNFHVWLAQSSDTGNTFGAPFQVTFPPGVQAGAIMIRDSMQMHMVLGMLGSPSYLHSSDGGVTWDSAFSLGTGSEPYIVRNECALHVIWAGGGKIHYRSEPNGNLCTPVNVSHQSSSQIQLTVSPNPAFQNVQLIFSEIADIESVSLYDFSGRIIEQRNQNRDMINWNVNSLSSGVYFFIAIQENEMPIMQKFYVIKEE